MGRLYIQQIQTEHVSRSTDEDVHPTAMVGALALLAPVRNCGCGMFAEDSFHIPEVTGEIFERTSLTQGVALAM